MFKLQRTCWNNMSREAMMDVAAHIDEGADLNFMGVWLEHDAEAGRDMIQVAHETTSMTAKQLLAVLLLQHIRMGMLSADDFLDIFAWVTAQRAKDTTNESPETPTTETE